MKSSQIKTTMKMLQKVQQLKDVGMSQDELEAQVIKQTTTRGEAEELLSIIKRVYV